MHGIVLPLADRIPGSDVGNFDIGGELFATRGDPGREQNAGFADFA
jgi:hypothetical protein